MIPPIPILVCWPLLALLFFGMMKFERALIVTVISGYLFLPNNVSLDLPLLPPLTKASTITYSLLLGWALFHHRAKARPRLSRGLTNKIVLLCILALVVGPFFTVQTNSTPIVIGPSFRSGLGTRDWISMVISTFIVLSPFFLAYRYLATEESHKDILAILVWLALVYSLLVLFEWRMSPQLNQWVYGYFPHDWRQHVRGGGFRPLVFLRHGLWLGFFLLSALLAAFALVKSEENGRTRSFWALSGLWLLVVLLLSRNTAAAILGVLFLALFLFTTRRLQLRLAMIVAVLFLAYPQLHQTSILPLRAVVTFFEEIAPARAQSFAFRLDNDDKLMRRALENPAWGWGGYGRNRVFDEKGRDTTTIDGAWIITFSTRGWVGYLGYFGLLVVSLLALPNSAKRRIVAPATSCIALITAANLLYLIPNSALSPIGWLFAGALTGFCRTAAVSKAQTSHDLDASKTRYSRWNSTSDLGSKSPDSIGVDSKVLPNSRNLRRIQPHQYSRFRSR